MSPADMVHVGARVPGYRQISVEAHSVDEILAALTSVAEGVAALMAAPEAEALRQRTAAVVDGLRERLARVQALVAGQPRRRVVCLEWLDPFYCSGHWVPELVTLAGGEDPLGRPGVDSVRIPWQQVCDAAPEVLVALPCSLDLAQAVAEARRLAGLPGATAMSALQSDNLWAVWSERYFSGSSPRVVDGVEVLVAILHPAVAGHLLPPDAAVRVGAAI